MGADGLKSITYSGSAANGNFGQSKTIAGPLAVTTITNYTRAIDFTQPASRATGATMPPAIPGAPPPQPGTFNQNITPANAAWTQQLEIWVTPWGFLKGAAANNATVRSQQIGGKAYNVVSWTPAQKAPSGQPYRLNGYIDDQNMVERVETWVEHPVLGDLLVDTSYSDYQDFGGLKVPTKIVQKRADLTTFEATITERDRESRQPHAADDASAAGRPRRAGAGRGAAPAPRHRQRSRHRRWPRASIGSPADMWRSRSSSRTTSSCSKAGRTRRAAWRSSLKPRRRIPNKPIRYVVNTHAHFDHASGLAPFAAEGITIITHANNKSFLEKALSGPRTLVGDNLAKANKKPKVESAGDKKVLKDDTHTIELLPHQGPGA